MTDTTEAPQQLALALPVLARPAGHTPARVVVPLRLRISEATAQRGLQHVAELRQLLADRQAAREGARPAA